MWQEGLALAPRTIKGVKSISEPSQNSASAGPYLAHPHNGTIVLLASALCLRPEVISTTLRAIYTERYDYPLREDRNFPAEVCNA